MTEIRGAVPLRAFEGLRRWRRKSEFAASRRKRIAELDALDDRILQDIGVDRRAIPELVDAQLRLEAEADAAKPRPASARPGFGAHPSARPSARPCTQPC